MDYRVGRKWMLREAILIKQMEPSPISVFVAYGYVRHAGSRWPGGHCILYHSHIVSKSHDLSDAKAFAYKDNTALDSKMAAVFLGGGLDQPESDSDGGKMMRSGCSKGSDSERSECALSA